MVRLYAYEALHRRRQRSVETRHFWNFVLGVTNCYGFVAQNVAHFLPFSESKSDHLGARKSHSREPMFETERFWRLVMWFSFDMRFLACRTDQTRIAAHRSKALDQGFRMSHSSLCRIDLSPDESAKSLLDPRYTENQENQFFTCYGQFLVSTHHQFMHAVKLPTIPRMTAVGISG